MTTETGDSFDRTEDTVSADMPVVIDFVTYRETGMRQAPVIPPETVVEPEAVPEPEIEIVTEEPVTERQLSKLRAAGRLALRCAAGTVLVAAAPLSAVAAAEYGPATHTTAAGLDATSHIKLLHDTSTLDLGVFGNIRFGRHKDVLGLSIGMDSRINGSQLNLNDPTVRAATGQILNRPEPEMDRIIRTTTKDTLEHAAIGGGAMLTFELIAGGILIGRRRNYGAEGEWLEDQQRHFNRRESRALAGLAASLILVPTVLGGHVMSSPEHGSVVADPALENTALHGAELDGIIQDTAPTLISAMQKTEKLDEVMAQNTVKLVGERPGLMPQEGWTYFLQADDLQDRSGMARQFGVLAKALGVNFITMTGDWSTISQLGFGSYLMDTVRYESGGNIPTWIDDGNHDTNQTNQYAKLAGFNVGDNKTHSVNGVPMLFLNSIDVSTLGAEGLASELRDPNIDADKAVQNAVKEILETKPQIVFMHDNHEATALAEACIKAGYAIPFIVTGRSFNQVGPQTITVDGFDGSTKMFTSGSSGGHKDTTIEFGNILVNSPINLFARNNATGQINYATFTFHPNGSVTAPETMTEIVPPRDEDVVAGATGDKKEAAAADKVVIKK
jgi:hypothetical protein